MRKKEMAIIAALTEELCANPEKIALSEEQRLALTEAALRCVYLKRCQAARERVNGRGFLCGTGQSERVFAASKMAAPRLTDRQCVMLALCLKGIDNDELLAKLTKIHKLTEEEKESGVAVLNEVCPVPFFHPSPSLFMKE